MIPPEEAGSGPLFPAMESTEELKEKAAAEWVEATRELYKAVATHWRSIRPPQLRLEARVAMEKAEELAKRKGVEL